jgi:hypothetical protein
VVTSRSDLWAELLSAAEAPRAATDRRLALRTAVDLGNAIVPVSLGCSISERAGSDYRSVSVANDLSLALDRVQYAAGAGPCLVAATAGTRQYVDIVADKDKYPAYAGAALEQGVRSSLSLPVPDPGRVAALNLYAATPDAFDPETEAVADLLARCVARLLPGSMAGRRADPDGVAARRARMQRAVQAVMDAEGLSHAAAFDRLARRSRAERRSVHRVAEDVLAGIDPAEGR